MGKYSPITPQRRFVIIKNINIRRVLPPPGSPIMNRQKGGCQGRIKENLIQDCEASLQKEFATNNNNGFALIRFLNKML